MQGRPETKLRPPLERLLLPHPFGLELVVRCAWRRDGVFCTPGYHVLHQSVLLPALDDLYEKQPLCGSFCRVDIIGLCDWLRVLFVLIHEENAGLNTKGGPL